MTRTTTGLCIAAALGFAVSVGAQSSTTTTTPDQRTATRGDTSAKEVTVTGCLARAADGTFMLNNARSDDMNRSQSGATTTGSSNPTTTTAGTSPTGTTGTTAGSTAGTTAAEPSGSGAMHHEAMAWKLEGGTDLDRHVGHEIQVTGRTDWNEHSMSSSTTTAGASGSAASSATTTERGAKGMNEPRLEVSSVKMISSSCR